jgi:hypothetical protein
MTDTVRAPLTGLTITTAAPRAPIAIEAAPARELVVAQAWESARCASDQDLCAWRFVCCVTKKPGFEPGFFFLIDARIAKPGLAHSAGRLFVMNVRMPPMSVMTNHRRLARRIRGWLIPESATNAAEDAANDATDNATDRSCCLVAYIGAVRGAFRDALCLRRKRASKCCGYHARVQNIELHATTLSF